MIRNMEQAVSTLISFWRRIADQFGLQALYGYLIPEETNNFWYALGGVLGISLAFEFLTGFLLLFKYVPDAGLAYSVTQSLLTSPTWKVVLNFHYWNAFLIFGLLMLHMMRVFVSAAYRGEKRGLWFVGVFLAGLVFISYLTGEALHWDEVGFAVPWHISEFFQAVHLANFFHYNFADLLSISSATLKLAQIYAVHVALTPILIVIAVGWHFYLIKEKTISLPFWKKPTGRKVPFVKHVKIWFILSAFILGVVLMISAFVPRGAGTAPQLLPSSPFYGTSADPGELGVKPDFPISWTHGIHVFLGKFGVEPDIWGTVIGMVLMLGALCAIPFVDRKQDAPTNAGDVFNRARIWAFVLIALFWAVFLIGVIQNAIAGAG